MRILHIVTHPETDETESYAADLILGLHSKGFDQSVALLPRSQQRIRLEAANIPTIPLTAFRKFRLKCGWIKKPDILQCWTPASFHLVRSSPKNRAPAHIYMMDGYYDPRPVQGRAPFVATTVHIATHLKQNKVAESSIEIIPHYVDAAPIPPVSRTEFATPRDAKILLSLSKLHPYRGHDTLLQALKDLPQCIVWLVGDGPYRHELETLAHKLNIMDQVRFIGQRHDRSALIRTADAVIQPARHEPFGSIVPETWAAGTPLIACRNETANVLIEDGLNGLLIPVDDASALAVAVQRVLDDEPLRRRIIAHGYAAYIKDYTKESVLRQWIQLYQRLAGT